MSVEAFKLAFMATDSIIKALAANRQWMDHIYDNELTPEEKAQVDAEYKQARDNYDAVRAKMG